MAKLIATILYKCIVYNQIWKMFFQKEYKYLKLVLIKEEKSGKHIFYIPATSWPLVKHT